MSEIRWNNPITLSSKSYDCGYCGKSLVSEKGWHGVDGSTGSGIAIYICHHCSKPTFFDGNNIKTPGSVFGNEVEDVDNVMVQKLYSEARRCTTSNAFTATILSCRKLLMHIAVDKGAQEGQNFIDYVQYLSDQNYVPPDAKERVDHIRQKGNEANHEIVIMTEEDAMDLLNFIEMILKLVYEFPAKIKRKSVIAE